MGVALLFAKLYGRSRSSWIGKRRRSRIASNGGRTSTSRIALGLGTS
jgi:hypothetical protein